MRRSAAALWAAFALGAWQLVSVAVLGTSPASAALTAILGGLVILVVAAWGAVTGAAWAVWLMIVLGALMAIAPFAAGFRGEAAYVASDLITGILLILLGVVAAVDVRQAARQKVMESRTLTVPTGETSPAAQAGASRREDFDDAPQQPGDPVVRREEPDDEGRRAA
jgi:hypothetical protein